MVLQLSNCGVNSRQIITGLDIRENKNSEYLNTWAETNYPVMVYTIRKTNPQQESQHQNLMGKQTKAVPDEEGFPGGPGFIPNSHTQRVFHRQQNDYLNQLL